MVAISRRLRRRDDHADLPALLGDDELLAWAREIVAPADEEPWGDAAHKAVRTAAGRAAGVVAAGAGSGEPTSGVAEKNAVMPCPQGATVHDATANATVDARTRKAAPKDAQGTVKRVAKVRVQPKTGKRPKQLRAGDQRVAPAAVDRARPAVPVTANVSNVAPSTDAKGPGAAHAPVARRTDVGPAGSRLAKRTAPLAATSRTGPERRREAPLRAERAAATNVRPTPAPAATNPPAPPPAVEHRPPLVARSRRYRFRLVDPNGSAPTPARLILTSVKAPSPGPDQSVDNGRSAEAAVPGAPANDASAAPASPPAARPFSRLEARLRDVDERFGLVGA